MSTIPRAQGEDMADGANAIVDAHHHVWRRKDLAWLDGPMIPRIFGPYEPIRRDYPMEEYLADAAGHRVAKSVYVQTNWGPGRGLDEVAWVEEVAAATGWPHAIVAHGDLLAEGFGDQLEALSRHPLVRGVRMQLFHHPNPAYRVVEDPEVLDDPRLVASLRRIERAGMAFDLQVFPGQMEAAARLVGQVPELRIALVHAGMCEDLSAAGREEWRSGMKRLAQFPNLSVKLSGLGTFVRRPDPEPAAAITSESLEIFGFERCMFGSNFPVEKLWASFGQVVEGVLGGLRSLSSEQRRRVMSRNAEDFYRL